MSHRSARFRASDRAIRSLSARKRTYLLAVQVFLLWLSREAEYMTHGQSPNHCLFCFARETSLGDLRFLLTRLLPFTNVAGQFVCFELAEPPLGRKGASGEH